jgi:membrane-associated phospholipid phosphatase
MQLLIQVYLLKAELSNVANDNRTHAFCKSFRLSNVIFFRSVFCSVFETIRIFVLFAVLFNETVVTFKTEFFCYVLFITVNTQNHTIQPEIHVKS